MSSLAIRTALLATAVAVLLSSGPVQGQADSATGLPQSLAPGAPDSAEPPRGEAPSDLPSDSPAPSAEPVEPVTRGSFSTREAVAVGALGTLEGPVAGTLDEAAGGLGPSLWDGSERAVVETLLRNAPAATVSGSSRLLLRKLLLTAAAAPAGQGQTPFNALRLRKLLEAGQLEDAANLAAVIRSRDPETQQAQADALLFAGRDEEACGEATAARLQSADPFWVALRAYCYAVAGDTAALDLTRAVIEQQRLTHTDFLVLLDALLAGKASEVPQLMEPTSIHLRMLVRLDLPIPAHVVDMLGMPARLVAIRSPETGKPVRLTAAADALAGRALPVAEIPAILDLFTFRPQDLAVAAAMARSEAPLAALARLRAALKLEKNAERRAELITAAFQKAESEGLLPDAAVLFADEAAALVPQRAWDNWSSIMVRALLLAGRVPAAGRWLDVLDEAAPVDATELHFLRVVFAVIAPADPHAALADESLSALALQAGAADARAEQRARAVLAVGLFEATGRDIPASAREQIASFPDADLPGRRPAPVALERIDRAALAGRRGDVGLGVVDVLGQAGARALAPDVVVDLVRALRTAGINDAARTLTREALLTRPAV